MTGTYGQPVVSLPRSSNRTCPSRASGFPTGFTATPTQLLLQRAPSDSTRSNLLRVATQLDREQRDKYAVCQTFVNDRSVVPSQAHQKQGPFPSPALPGFNGSMALSESRLGRHPVGDVRGATPPAPGLPQLRRSLFLHAVLTTPADQTGACIGFFPVCAAFPG